MAMAIPQIEGFQSPQVFTIDDTDPEVLLREILSLLEKLESQSEDLLLVWREQRRTTVGRIHKFWKKVGGYSKKKENLKKLKQVLLVGGVAATVLGMVLGQTNLSHLSDDFSMAGNIMRNSSKIANVAAGCLSPELSKEFYEKVQSDLERDIKFTFALKTWMIQNRTLNLHVEALFGSNFCSFRSAAGFNGVVSVFQEVAKLARWGLISNLDVVNLLCNRSDLPDIGAIYVRLVKFMENCEKYGQLSDLLTKLSQRMHLKSSQRTFKNCMLSSQLWTSCRKLSLNRIPTTPSLLNTLKLKQNFGSSELGAIESTKIAFSVTSKEWLFTDDFKVVYCKLLQELEDLLRFELLNVDNLFPDNEG